MSGKPKDGLYLDHQALKVLTDRIAALEAELADSVPRGWDGLLTILTDIYPASIFGGVDADWKDETRDLGPRLTTLAYHLDAERKRAEAAEAEAMRWKLLGDERWGQCQHESKMRDEAEARLEKTQLLYEAAEAERDNLAAALRHENVNADDRFAAMLREAREGREQDEAELANLEERRKAAESDYFDVRGEVERLRWMLRQDIAETCPFGERSPDGIESCPNCSTRLADLESRWAAREEAGDDG